MIAIVFIIKIEHISYFIYYSEVLFSSIFSLQAATASAACICLEIQSSMLPQCWLRDSLLYYIGEGVWNDCDHYDDCYQQNYTSGTDLSDILSLTRNINLCLTKKNSYPE